MGGLDWLPWLGDVYERKARLYPATLALVPLFTMLVGLYGLPIQIETGVLAVFAGVGVFFLMAAVTREFGKRLEKRLFRKWDGAPTTQLLRHKDQTVDRVTKARYHAFLGRTIFVDFPSAGHEAADPDEADQAYRSAVNWLREHTRDRKVFSILFKENVSYGFHRNCLGIKPIAVTIASLSIVWVLIVGHVVGLGGIRLSAFAELSTGGWVSLGVSGLMLLIWLGYITDRTLKTTAFAYADALLRACDLLADEDK